MITRRTTEDTLLFGIFPTATQRSVTAERIGRVVLRAVRVERLPGLGIADTVWRLETVSVAGAPVIGGSAAAR